MANSHTNTKLLQNPSNYDIIPASTTSQTHAQLQPRHMSTHFQSRLGDIRHLEPRLPCIITPTPSSHFLRLKPRKTETQLTSTGNQHDHIHIPRTSTSWFR
ncbi:hypothetical protein M758_10G157500 [Ceratodon purpureus]|uniref:Uncharacterized protein n=1 Tax=Ceratodon purpureus TaxID=3225 RepID=A0A8T0GNZ2_CERPU|nr:hypothetical protein KC19_10G161900 [Ceratodon purpureus]KAG0604260.1 hypothetical protein M758_10G157500 [Ceratodon purpureus]